MGHLQDLLLGLVRDHLQQTLVRGGESELGSVTHLVNVSEEHHTGLGDDGRLPIDLQDRSDRIDLHGLAIQLTIDGHHLVKQSLPEGSKLVGKVIDGGLRFVIQCSLNQLGKSIGEQGLANSFEEQEGGNGARESLDGSLRVIDQVENLGDRTDFRQVGKVGQKKIDKFLLDGTGTELEFGTKAGKPGVGNVLAIRA